MIKKPTYEDLEKRIQELEKDKIIVKHINDKLQESEKKYRVLTESMQDVIIKISPTGKLQYVSPTIKNFAGYNPENEIGNNISKYFENKIEILHAFKLIKKVLITRQSGKFDFLFKPKNKKPFQVEHTYVPIISNNKVISIQLVLRDISQRRIAEESYKRIAQEWTSAMDASKDIIYILDNNRCLIRANSAFYKSMNSTPEEAIGQHIVKIIHPQGEVVSCPLCTALEKGRDVVTIIEADAANNPTGNPMEITVKIIRDGDGSPSGIFINLHDLTIARATEQKLLSSEKKLKTLLDATTDEACLAESDGTLLTVNNALETRIGKKEEELIGKSMFEFISGQVFEKRKIMLQKTVISKSPVQWKEKHAGKYFDNSIYPIFDDYGDVEQIAVFIKDITTQLEAEETLNRYKHIISATDDHMSFINRDYTYVAVNDAYLEANQKERKEIIGHSVSDLHGIDIFEQVIKAKLDRCFAGETIYYQDWFSFFGLGKRYMDVAYYPHSGTDGVVSGVIVSSHDITEHEKAKDQLKMEQSRLVGILDSIPYNVYIVDQYFNIQYVNPVIKKDFGEIKGLKCYQYFHNRTKKCSWCKNKEVFAGKSVAWEFYAVKTDKYYKLFDTPFVNPDGSISKFEIFHDISDLKQTHHELEAKVKDRTQKLTAEIVYRKKAEKTLKLQTEHLSQANKALQSMLENREAEQRAMENQILLNIKQFVLPYIEMIERMNPGKDLLLTLNILKQSMTEFVSPASKRLFAKYANLTPREVKVADLIRHGKKSKEIAELLHISPSSVSTYRNHIRKKIGLLNKSTNLETYLNSFDL